MYPNSLLPSSYVGPTIQPFTSGNKSNAPHSLAMLYDFPSCGGVNRPIWRFPASTASATSRCASFGTNPNSAYQFSRAVRFSSAGMSARSMVDRHPYALLLEGDRGLHPLPRVPLRTVEAQKVSVQREWHQQRTLSADHAPGASIRNHPAASRFVIIFVMKSIKF